jgi:hypothetical protein
VSLLLAAVITLAPDDAIARWHRARRRTQLAGMGVLGGWALVNIAGGVAGSFTDRDRKYFHQGNAIWNSVNLAIAIAGIAGNARKRPPPKTFAAAKRVQQRTRRTYFVNALVDLLYIAAGTATIAIGQHYHQRRVYGYGEAVAFQGAFLFAFDVGMLIAHDRLRLRKPSSTTSHGHDRGDALAQPQPLSSPPPSPSP